MKDQLRTDEGTHVDMIARILVGSDWDDGVRYTDIGTRETVEHLARQIIATLQPAHYREAAGSLDHIHPEAARLLRSVAKDLEEGEPE
ncbi:hypothetical protein [Glycomyces tenuis]|uniref:hypothetical protein n=1 Tax=Glycomyces tenuis TaxID=58116 RepID=UPI0004108A72|nr:hypothetical protein [Glycomyces tenuis]